MILVDTNVLARIADPASDQCEPARSAVRALRFRGEKLVIAPQNIYEFWSVATRPAGRPPGGGNGLGMSASRADQWLDYLARTMRLLQEPTDLPHLWRALVRTFNVIGPKSHDARLIAVMQAHQLHELLTFNAADFKRFYFIKILEPETF